MIPEKDVLNIRKEYLKRTPQIVLARKYNVGKNCIWHIIKRNTWRHI